MPISQKNILKKSDFLTAADFAEKYSIDKKLASKAVMSLYKQHRFAKNNAGILRPVIIPKNRLIHPLFHNIVLAEIEKQKKFLMIQHKGLSHEI